MDNGQPLNNSSARLVSQEEGKEVGKKHLINILNYLNFTGGTIQVNFKHVRYNQTVSCQAKPQPCDGDKLDCNWTDLAGLNQKLEMYQFQNLLVSDGLRLFLVKPELRDVNVNGISLILPEKCYDISSRKVKRHLCQGINIQLCQNSVLFYGSLINFNAISFLVEIKIIPPQTTHWLNSELPVNIVLFDDLMSLYSGECRILRMVPNHNTITMALEALNHQISRYKPKEFRSLRQTPTPSPKIIFKHPFIKKKFSLDVLNLSSSGFAVEENEDNSVLLPGMIIPELELNIANSFKIRCQAQVIYRKINSNKNNLVRCGLAILDLDIKDHMRLTALIHKTKDNNSNVCNEVDPDSLWEFFFETGFIYPKKYKSIELNKEKLKKTYEKLYSPDQNIARHFIYQHRGRILGHMAMLRFYENSWLIQHHASRVSIAKRAGFIVLNQAGYFISNSHILHSIHMHFVFCYFRPENKFPDRVFGGVARKMKNPKGCSLDTLAYFHFQRTEQDGTEIPKPWELTSIRPEDLQELIFFYQQESGGLMLKAFDLDLQMIESGELSKEYQRLGLKRERHLFSLKLDGRLKAVIMADISDFGLNLSDLTNSFKVMVVDPDALTKEIFRSMLSWLAQKFGQPVITVLLYPVRYAEDQSLNYEKLYKLWVLNMQNTDDYFRHLPGPVKPN